MESIDLTLFINLNRRTDRLEEIQGELGRLSLKHVERFPAIEEKRGVIGCTKSHIECLKIGIEREVDTLMVCEDDLLIVDPEALDASLKSFLESETPWDVIFIAGNVLFPVVIHSPGAFRVKNCQTTTAYLVKKHYLPTLLANFETSLANATVRPKDPRWCLDIHWKVLQQKDRWFALRPFSACQRDSYSDIEKRVTSYGKEMLKVGIGQQKKVVVNLQGGTGNQLFQAAYGFALAKRIGGQVVRSNVECKSLRQHTGIAQVLGGLPKGKPLGIVVNQKGWAFHEHDDGWITPSWDTDLLVKGYYQSSKFFREGFPAFFDFIKPSLHIPVIRRKLKMPHPSTIVLHILRGDYLKHPGIHPSLKKGYYLQAISYLRDLMKGPIRIIVCSDDLNWCRNQTWLTSATKKVLFPTLNVRQTLALMSKASNLIIANSTLSWWGAFLACHRDSTAKVVAPSHWFGPKVNHDTRDMYEPSWYVI